MTVFVEHFPPFLGSDKTIFELATRVAKRGVKVHFIATQPLRYLVGERPDNWSYKDNWLGDPPIIHENITAKYLLVGRRIENLWHRFPPLAFILTLILFTIWSLREIIHMKPDVIAAAHASLIVGVVAMVSSKLTFRPLIMGCPDWMTAYAAGLVSNPLANIGLVVLQIVETGLYKVSSHIVAATHFLKALLIEHGVKSEKITVIPNGVDPILFSPDVDSTEIRKKYRLENRTVILFTGHLEEWAGLTLLYDLAKRLNDAAPDAHILIVGAGASVNDLLNKLVRNNLSHMITYAGLHPFEDMPGFNAVADIALCIFPDTPVAHAASPLKLFEYMGSGSAIVATKVCGTEEVLDENAGILIPPGNSEAICDAVIRLCMNHDLAAKLGIQARLDAEKAFSWDSLAEKFYDVCRGV